MKTFKTVIIYKADKPKRTVNTGLTKVQAQKEVQTLTVSLICLFTLKSLNTLT